MFLCAQTAGSLAEEQHISIPQHAWGALSHPIQPLGAKHRCGAGWDATPRMWGEGQRLAGAGSGLRAPRCGVWHRDTSQGHGLMQGFQSAFPFFI